jgi:hypothetical protein
MNNNKLLGTPMKLLSTMPHQAGAQTGKENAEFTAEDLSNWSYLFVSGGSEGVVCASKLFL